jgi:hypothetical protein
LRDLVGAGAGQEWRPADDVVRGAGRGWRGEEQREFVKEIGVGVAQMEGDRAGRVVGDDPGGQVAAPRVPVARLGAEDAFVVGGISAEAERTLRREVIASQVCMVSRSLATESLGAEFFRCESLWSLRCGRPRTALGAPGSQPGPQQPHGTRGPQLPS